MMSIPQFQAELEQYQPYNEREEQHRVRFLDLLKEKNCFLRASLAAHFTASAWVTTPDLTNVLLLHHAKLDRWLQPGGHADGETNLLQVAKKELMEETGINIVNGKGSFFDLDIHTIPERKGVPTHEHFDVRYHFIVDRDVKLHQNEESNQVRWFHVEEVAQVTQKEESILRMINKTLAKIT